MAGKKDAGKLETATFAAGCFWGVEEIYRTLKGVKETAVGYSGGNMKNPSYEDVCGDETGHAEAVQIKFDPKEVSYEKLVDIFFKNHNPTTMNMQGPDVGSQYRSAIFYHNDGQKKIAEKVKKDVEKSGKWKHPIVTQIDPAGKFYEAEDYHQKYYFKRGMKAVCRI
jgi:peptide-methionine (S)-S-oxide reductase